MDGADGTGGELRHKSGTASNGVQKPAETGMLSAMDRLWPMMPGGFLRKPTVPIPLRRWACLFSEQRGPAHALRSVSVYRAKTTAYGPWGAHAWIGPQVTVRVEGRSSHPSFMGSSHRFRGRG